MALGHPLPFYLQSESRANALLNLDGCAFGFELGLGVLGSFLGNTREQGVGSAFDGILSLFETEGGEGTHHLDDVDLLGATFGEDDIELSLLLNRLGSRNSATAGGGCGDRSR